jgi:hypothetical protein
VVRAEGLLRNKEGRFKLAVVENWIELEVAVEGDKEEMERN